MKIEHLIEPRLVFGGENTHICPRKGISEFGVYDHAQDERRSEIRIGGIGTPQCIELLEKWLNRCEQFIPALEDAKQKNLRVPFCGFNKSHGFHSQMIFSSNLMRPIKNAEIERIIKIGDRKSRVMEAIDCYYENIKFLAQSRPVDVVVCVIPENLYKVISTEETAEEEKLEAEISEKYEELNFRRALKARAMQFDKPLQLIKQISLDGAGSASQQDDATKAWNFCSALYYKSGPTVPWKLQREDSRPTSCAIGLSFYRSRDRDILRTSLAQIFDELGNGLILRGTPVKIDKFDRRPRISAQDACKLLRKALSEYRIALRTFPARVIIHKSSNFSEEEIEGLEAAAHESSIDTIDFVTVMDSDIRLFRDGNYPPFRGTLAQIDEKRQILYTRGSVWFYQTYPGLYVPKPLELRIVKSEESAKFIAQEILGLTKMNWNNTQFDGRHPVTLGCSRKVGEIMKYLGETEKPQIRYGYYM